ncbi:hypothetical protein [Flavobacterium sp.]|uniref:hypothetical protein n=1 Tax=Flavobacterium sp. TaxID=239 RepID=UPI0025B9D722|nr:hypothetical protein [Flavobacterium sp.]
MNFSIFIPAFIVFCTGIGVLGFKSFKIFNYYIDYLYFTVFLALIFLVGWNIALFYSSSPESLIDWWFLLSLVVLLIYTKIIHIVTKTKYYKVHGHEW